MTNIFEGIQKTHLEVFVHVETPSITHGINILRLMHYHFVVFIFSEVEKVKYCMGIKQLTIFWFVEFRFEIRDLIVHVYCKAMTMVHPINHTLPQHLTCLPNCFLTAFNLHQFLVEFYKETLIQKESCCISTGLIEENAVLFGNVSRIFVCIDQGRKFDLFKIFHF